MSSVRQATIDLFRRYGLTTWFGNPGSSELTLLEDFPDDFRYVLGLQEMVPVGMADAYAQVTGRPAVVNVHTAPGMGNLYPRVIAIDSPDLPLTVRAVRASLHRAPNRLEHQEIRSHRPTLPHRQNQSRPTNPHRRRPTTQRPPRSDRQNQRST
jgi:hypothetical protein